MSDHEQRLAPQRGKVLVASRGQDRKRGFTRPDADGSEERPRERIP
ncbi:hypothetical protein ACIQAD_21385 [Streptomyces sp. NPDC088551]